MKVLKFPLPLQGESLSFSVSANAKILCAKAQGKQIVVYIEHDDNWSIKETVQFYSAWTGRDLPPNRKAYIDTIMLDELGLVVHIYQLP